MYAMMGIIVDLAGYNRVTSYYVEEILSSFVFTGFLIASALTFWHLLRDPMEPVSPRVGKYNEDLLSGDDLALTVQTLLGHKNNGVWCGRVNDVDLYASTEDRAVVIGPPGTGKTTFLIAQLMDWIQSGRSFVSLDIKPEIFGILRFELEQHGYRVITYNPTAQTGQRYNFMTDLDSPEAIGELAGYLIPPDHHGSSNAVFVESARDFLDAIVSHLKAMFPEPTLPDVRDFVTQFDQHGALLDALKQSPDQDARELANGLAITASNERLLGSIFATFRSNLRFLRYPAIRDSLSASDFSLSELGGEQPVALFLQFEEKNKGITERLLVAFVNHLFRYLITHTTRGKVLILLDELGNAPRIDGLVEKLNTIRSRNLPTWMYFQSVEQMQLYGTMAGEGINKILGACDYQQVFRLNDNASAEMMSTAIGVVDREVFAENATYGNHFVFSTLDSQTQTKTLVKEPIIYPHEFRKLGKNESITIYQGVAWRGESTPYFKLYPEYQGIQPAAHEVVAQPYAV